MKLTVAALAALAAGAATEVEKIDAEIEKLDNETETEHRRELFPVYAVGSKCARRGCSIYHQITQVNPMMSVNDPATRNAVKGPVKALEMLALNDDLNTVVQSD